MRTTVRLDAHVLASAKQLAARTGRTLTAVIEDALRQTLADTMRGRKAAPAELPTFKGDGLRAGVDLDDTAALLELMDEAR